MAVRGRFVVPAGLAVLGISVLLLAAAASWPSLPLLVAASVCAGLGQGVAFRTVFNDVAAKVEVSHHAQVISTVYVITYLGSAVPVIGLGWATSAFGLQAAVLGFVLVCCAAALTLAALTFRTARRQRTA
jgi:nitrate/nitrite transporter NarK